MDFTKITDEALRLELEAQFDTEIATIKEGAQNDPEFVKGVKFNAQKEAERKFNKMLKDSYGLDATDLEGAESSEDYLKIGLAKTKTNATSTAQEVQDKYLLLKAEYTKLKDEDLPNAFASADERVKKFQIQAVLSSKLGAFENLSIPKSDLAIILESRLRDSNVVLDLDANGNVIALTKDGLKPTMNDKAIDFDGLTNHYATPFIKQNGVADKTQQATTTTIPQGMSDAKKKIIADYQARGVDIPQAILDRA